MGTISEGEEESIEGLGVCARHYFKVYLSVSPDISDMSRYIFYDRSINMKLN